MTHIKTKKYACYRYHSYHRSKECGEEMSNQTEEEQKAKVYHHYMIFIVIATSTIIIVIMKTKIKQETSHEYHITTANSKRCPCKMWLMRIWSCTAGLPLKCANREMNTRADLQ